MTEYSAIRWIPGQIHRENLNASGNHGFCVSYSADIVIYGIKERTCFRGGIK